MTTLVRKWVLLVALGVVSAPALAIAGSPNPIYSTMPARINVYSVQDPQALPGSGGEATPFEVATVIVRDDANIPIGGALVRIDFSNCPGAKLCRTQDYPGVTSSSDLSISAVTNASGTARLVCTGYGSATASCGTVWADNVLLGTIQVGMLTAGGTEAALGLSQYAYDWFSNWTASRSDFDNDGSVTAIDLSIWVRAFIKSLEPVPLASCTSGYWE